MFFLNIYSQHLRKEKQQLVEIKLLKQLFIVLTFIAQKQPRMWNTWTATFQKKHISSY